MQNLVRNDARLRRENREEKVARACGAHHFFDEFSAQWGAAISGYLMRDENGATCYDSHAMPTEQRKLLGRYIVADPKICHGKPTFPGTRVMVAQVLKQVGKGTPWDTITAEWRGSVTRDAIAEAVELAHP